MSALVTAARSAGPQLWSDLMSAARGDVSSGPAATARRLSVADGRPRLGWVIPAPWDRVSARLAETAQPMPDTGGLLVASTGGWAFAARALAQCARPGRTLSVVDTLDAPALAALLTDAGDAGPDRFAAALTVSASGRTYETRHLADLIETACRRDGRRVHRLSESSPATDFSLHPGQGVNALFGAPCSLPFALLAAAATGAERYRHAYTQFCDLAPATGQRAADLACALPPEPVPRLETVLPHGTGQDVRLWVLQAMRQGLSGAPGRPVWSDVRTQDDPGCGGGPVPSIDLTAALPSGPLTPLLRLMILTYAAAVLTACLGIRWRIPFAEHTAVDRYKALLDHAPHGPATPVDAHDLPRAAGRWLAAHSDLTGAHLVRFGESCPPASPAQLTQLTGRPWEVHPGSRWNHHSYQAAHADPRIGVAAVVPEQPHIPPTGDRILDEALRDVHGRQLAIARATCASLPGRSTLFLVKDHPGSPR